MTSNISIAVKGGITAIETSGNEKRAKTHKTNKSLKREVFIDVRDNYES
jgi:hypothetical protein